MPVKILKGDTLMDRTSLIKYIIDSTRIYITAIDGDGKQLWKTDPFVDGKLPGFRVVRPVITGIRFTNAEDKEIIAVGFSDHQFGVLYKKTGEFTYLGGD